MSRIGRYEVESELGRGASGVVYLAHDPRVRRAVAAKTFALPSGLTDAEVRECRERFLREAQAAGSLSHPGIVTIYDADFDEDRGEPFIAMEYVPGRSLQAALHEHGTLPIDSAVALAIQVVEALRAAHLAGIIHRDVKPANILLRDDDRTAKLADFGVARLSTSELTRSGTTVGSPAYMSPEQIRGDDVDGRSDLFSLAAILYETISGRRPFDGDDIASLAYSIAHAAHARLAGRIPGATAALDRFFDRALAKDPHARFQDADAFLAGLRRAAISLGDDDPFDGLPTGRRPAELVAPEETVESVRRPRSLRPIVLGALLLLMLVIGGRALLGPGAKAWVNLDGKTMVAGKVTMLADGDRVWSRQLEPPSQPSGRLARVFRGRGEEFEATFAVPAGTRELAVRVERSDGGPDLRDSVVAEFRPGERHRVRLVVGRPLGAPISLRVD